MQPSGACMGHRHICFNYIDRYAGIIKLRARHQLAINYVSVFLKRAAGAAIATSSYS